MKQRSRPGRFFWLGLGLLLAVGVFFVVHGPGESGADEQTAPELVVASSQQAARAEELVDRLSEKPVRDRQHASARIQTEGPAERPDPYLESSSVFEMASMLIEEGQLDEMTMGSMMSVWANVCRRAVGLAAHARDKDKELYLSGEPSRMLEGFCSEMAEEVGRDSWAYARAWEDVTGEEVNPFEEMVERGELDAVLKAALDVLYGSRNEVEIFHALNAIFHVGNLESPFPEVAQESIHHLFTERIQYDATLVFLCRNLGGCSGEHPLVARHCLLFELHDGCYRPRDIYDALQQTQTPLQQIIFWSLLDQIAALYQRHG